MRLSDKAYISNNQLNGKIKEIFIKGLIIGFAISLILSYYKYKYVITTGHKSDKNEIDIQTFMQVIQDDAPKVNEEVVYKKKDIIAYVGIQTGFTRHYNNPKYVYENRRNNIRLSWLPKDLKKYENETGIVVRFVIGHSKDSEAENNLYKEEAENNDFLRLDIEEGYLSLTYKTMKYIKTVMEYYNPKYIIKIDDDVYFRIDRLPYAIKQWENFGYDYVGCMKRGSVYTKERTRWYEPQYEIIGNSYYTHTWGSLYVLSNKAANIISSMPKGSLRFFNNEDTTVGAWMMAFNISHFDDRRLCQRSCKAEAIGIYDLPTCAGLCHPDEFLELHAKPECTNDPLPDGESELPMLSESIPVSQARSGKLQ